MMACEKHIKVKMNSSTNVPGLNQNLLQEQAYKTFVQNVLKERVPDVVFKLANTLKINGASGVDVVGGFNRDLTQEYIDALTENRKPVPTRIDNSDFDLEVGGMTMNG